jgi:hypothetical protein
MAIQDLAVAQRVGQRLAETLRDEPTVKQLWAWGALGHVEPGRESVDLWVFLDSADDETEKRIVASVSPLQEQFPDVYLFLHLTNGQMPHDFDPLAEIYPGAEQIPVKPR